MKSPFGSSEMGYSNRNFFARALKWFRSGNFHAKFFLTVLGLGAILWAIFGIYTVFLPMHDQQEMTVEAMIDKALQDILEKGATPESKAKLIRLQIRDRKTDDAHVLLLQVNDTTNSTPFIADAWGWYYLAIMDNENALAAFNKAIELDPELLQAHIGKGYVFLGENKTSDAKLIFLKVMEMNSTYGPAYAAYGDYLYEVKDLEKAKSMYLRSLELNTNRERTYLKLGRIYYLSGDLDKAAAYANRSLSINKNYGKAYGLLGEISMRNQDILEAEKMFGRLVELEPYDKSAKEWLILAQHSLNSNTG